MFYVVHETRIGSHGVHPYYFAYGPYTTKEYARTVVRDLAQVHGAHVWSGMNQYRYENWRSGLLNIHKVSIVEGPIYVDMKHNEIDIKTQATKYEW